MPARPKPICSSGTPRRLAVLDSAIIPSVPAKWKGHNRDERVELASIRSGGVSLPITPVALAPSGPTCQSLGAFSTGRPPRRKGAIQKPRQTRDRKRMGLCWGGFARLGQVSSRAVLDGRNFRETLY